jgi:DNA anti-recombination protein RmuC
VIAVSPNSFYAYLQAIAVGFRGLKIQSEAKKIEVVLARLKGDVGRLQGEWGKVGKHLKDAQTQFNNCDDRLERMQSTIEKLGLDTTEGAATGVGPSAEVAAASDALGEVSAGSVAGAPAVDTNI